MCWESDRGWGGMLEPSTVLCPKQWLKGLLNEGKKKKKVKGIEKSWLSHRNCDFHLNRIWQGGATVKELAMCSGDSHRNWVSPYLQMECDPEDSGSVTLLGLWHYYFSIYCSQKTTSSTSKVIPWIAWPPKVPFWLLTLSLLSLSHGTRIPFQTEQKI